MLPASEVIAQNQLSRKRNANLFARKPKCYCEMQIRERRFLKHVDRIDIDHDAHGGAFGEWQDSQTH
jgi:hypothetical protein